MPARAVMTGGCERSARRVVQSGVAAAGAGDADGQADGFGRSDEDDEFLGSGDGGVEQDRCGIIHERW